MKKILTITLVSLLSMSSFALAASQSNTSGGASKEDGYVAGQKDKTATDEKLQNPKNLDRGSHENTYVNGQKDGSPMDKTTIKESQQGSSGDGSPAE